MVRLLLPGVKLGWILRPLLDFVSQGNERLQLLLHSLAVIVFFRFR